MSASHRHGATRGRDRLHHQHQRTGSRHAGDKVLERIADATGGRPFFPFQLNDVANAFVEIQDELRSQYALSYKPSDLRNDGRYHTIEILAQNHKNLRVRSRRGYYAPAQ